MILRLYRDAVQVYHDSEGSFDITVGPLTRVWGFWDKSFRFPTQKEINACLKSVGMDKVKETGGSLLLSSYSELDWGGIAKGFGIDLAYQALLSIGIKRGFLNSGGDLVCWGKNPNNKNWQVGVKHPRKSGYLGVLSISDTAAATTGDYQRYFIKDDIRYHHVLDPYTGYPARGKQSVTVVGPKATFCDALSTALFVSKNPEKLLKKYPDYGAIVVDKEGNITILGKSYPFRIL
jgi:thiamine biosynthesis lipoprotein